VLLRRKEVPSIDVGFDVWKELTNRRRSESHTYDAVIRELLGMDEIAVVSGHSAPLNAFYEVVKSKPEMSKGAVTGVSFRGLFLPNETMLRATHKGKTYGAKISDGVWLSEGGETFGSPSAAASAITGNNVNGWRFWQAKRPSDSEWRNLDMLAKA
jgi:hypothetical protein